MRKKLLASVLCAVAVATSVAIASPASADSPNGSTTIGPGHFFRANLYQHGNGSGYVLTVNGNGSCTGSYVDRDTSWQNLVNVNGYYWNDAISSIKDGPSCGVKLYRDASFGGDSSRWFDTDSVNYVGDLWNDQASSFVVS